MMFPGTISVRAEVKKEKEEKKPETKKEEEYWVTAGTASFKVDKSKEWDAKGLLTRDLRAEDAAERKDPKEYGLDQPHLRAAIVHRKRDQKDAPEVTTTIAFGNAIKEEKEGSEKGENKAYYVMLEGEAGGGRIYTLSKWDYNTWNKELKDFEKPPEPKPLTVELKPEEPPPAPEPEKPKEVKKQAQRKAAPEPRKPTAPPPRPEVAPSTPAQQPQVAQPQPRVAPLPQVIPEPQIAQPAPAPVPPVAMERFCACAANGTRQSASALTRCFI